ncbi:MAG: toxic anion resistance protein [Eubacteriales bacterium]|nr:toxic anion resistance protein [Clostridiales bacterium]MDD6932259.1 toxic anion resistance protein [Eubacteriales bacterium]MDO4387540.1 toxic anion resistance protein [Eubacteriales bacterium]MDY2601943.1 toxic anion resistance protein [Eubacteriales bacterium]
MADEIKLTLGVPQAPNATEAVAEAAAEEQAVAQQVQADAAAKQVFSPEEQKMIDDFSKQIDIRDSNLVFAYGASAQQNIAQFSDSALKNVQTKDLDEVGDMITGLVKQLKGFSTDEEEGNRFTKWFRKQKDQLTEMKARYTDAETNVNKICEGLEKHQIQMLKDIAMLDKLYEQNLHYFKELSMYIAAGKKRLEEFRANDLAQAVAKAEASKLPEDAQAAKDLADKADRFEKKIYDLELTRNISIQMAPQIRLVQSSNQMMAEKIQTSLVNTIPLWKSQMVLALGVAHTQSAMEAQRAVSDLTNQLLTKNAQKLKMATVESAKESERGIVDIETLTKTNQMLMDTMDEVLTIQKDGKQRRAEAEKELSNIEDQLRKKILEINS